MTEAKSAGSGRTAKSQPQLKVMIIDPNPNNRDRLKGLVRELEFVDAVSDRGSPHSILDILATNPVHVIMIDQNPGAGDVFDIVRVIRSKSVGAHMRFVLIGDELDDEVRQRGAGVGIAAFLQRPYDLRGIEEALKTAAGAGGGTVESAQQARARDGLRDTLDKLRQVSLFHGFSDQELVRLLKICRTRQFPAGTYVFHEGDKGTSLFVLVAGQLQIRTQENGEDRVLVEMSPGDCFGEMAIIDAEPRSADAVAATDCTVIEVNESVVNSNNDILSLKLVRQIAILLAKKLRIQSHPAAR
ncbi:MAG TPA: cyclic nucleotide-binding domain-containing protein [bacterium]|nr:cyclic nucleotide-binding domain-containing protein [bacterium]